MGLEKEAKMSPTLWIPLHNGLDLQLIVETQLNFTDKHSCLISQGHGILRKYISEINKLQGFKLNIT